MTAGLDQPSWYTPKRLLAYFSLVLMLSYLDLGLFASNQVTGDDDEGNSLGVKARFGLNGLRLGLLPALYSAGMIMAGFIFAELAKHVNSFRLVGIGIVCWALGAVLTGASTSYPLLILARTLVGCGEAPLLTLTFTFVDDVAPPGAATLWFGVLGVAPVLGAAAGYVMAEPLCVRLGWRGAFFFEAGLAVVPAAFALLMPPVHLNMNAAQQQQPREHPENPGADNSTVRRSSSAGDYTAAAAGLPILRDGVGESETSPWPGPAAGSPRETQLECNSAEGEGTATPRNRFRQCELRGDNVTGSWGSAVGTATAAPGAQSAHVAPSWSGGSHGLDPADAGGALQSSGPDARHTKRGGRRAPLALHQAVGRPECGAGSDMRTPLTFGSMSSTPAVLEGSPGRRTGRRGGASGGASGGERPLEVQLGNNCGVGGNSSASCGSDADCGVWRRVRACWQTGCMAGPLELLRHPGCCLNNFGYAPVQWVIGLVSFWGPKAMKEVFGLSGSDPELVIGAITVGSGLVGTLAGGWALDAAGSSLRNGFLLQAAATGGALAALLLAFLAAQSYAGFCILLSLGLTALFASQAPSYALSMWTVPQQYRPLSQASIILLQHLLGDVPSPPITGALHDATGNWRASLAAAVSPLGAAVACFGAGALLAASGRAADFRARTCEEGMIDGEESEQTAYAMRSSHNEARTDRRADNT